MADLTSLSVRNLGIRVLTGIEVLHGLQALDLADNQITDLQPLAALDSLTTLDLTGNQVQDLAPLAGLNRLRFLELSDNQVTDLSPLAGLMQLQYLGLFRNEAQDLSPLLGLVQLQSVELSGNPLEPVSRDQHLQALAGRGVQVTCMECSAGGDTSGGPPTTGSGWRIAFLTDRDGNWEIYSMQEDGSDPVNVTNSPWDESTYTWSPDGTQIALTSSQLERASRYSTVYMLDLLSGVRRALVQGKDNPAYPSWLPDGRRLAIGYAGGGVMVLFDTIELRADTLQWSGWYPTWSPDGTRVACLSNEGASVTRGMDALWVRDADGTGARFLANGAHWSWPAWSPDGTRIAFAGRQDGSDLEILVAEADGSQVRRLTHHPDADSSPTWSPDGTRIAYVSSGTADPEIWVMAADGSDPTNLTRNPAIDAEPRWVRWGGGF
ncbi:MAG: leucine-rich repeat domain-containing protein [Candidatus Latescibacterota bacterium]